MLKGKEISHSFHPLVDQVMFFFCDIKILSGGSELKSNLGVKLVALRKLW